MRVRFVLGCVLLSGFLMAGCGGASNSQPEIDVNDIVEAVAEAAVEAAVEAVAEKAAEAAVEAVAEAPTPEAPAQENDTRVQTTPSPPSTPIQSTAPAPDPTVSAPSDGYGPNSGHNRENPCASLPEERRSQCEESFRANPNAKPDDPTSGPTADANERLPTDEVDYSNVYVQNYDPNNLPKVAKRNFTELDKFSRMTKIRSGVGHDFSYNTPEYDPTRSNCRSMKHYLIPVGAPRENALYATTPHTFPWMSIKFFAPADGRIVGVSYFENDYGTEAQFTIASTEYPGYFFMFFHLALDPALKEGSVVQAGQQIATLGDEEAWGEVAVSAKMGPGDHRLLSFLQVATDEVFQEYKSRGVNSASDVIFSKEQRDANPLPCDNTEAGWFIGSHKSGQLNPTFTTWVFESADNWFFFD